MQKLIIHIGAHKTGTSSIQGFLKKNRTNLQAKGWDLFFRRPEGHLSKDGSANSWIDFTGRKSEFKASINSKLIDSLLATKKNLILSSEEFFWLNDKDEIKSFIDKLSSKFTSIKIICYLRRQDLQLMSHFHQGFKFPDSTARKFYGDELKLKIKHEDYFKNYLDYYNKLKIWENSVGLQNLIVRVYEKSQLVESDSVKDFLTVLPFESAEWKFTKETSNKSLNKIQTIINHSTFEIRNSLWYELGKGKFTRSEIFSVEEPILYSDLADRNVLKYYLKSNELLKQFVPNLDAGWFDSNESGNVRNKYFDSQDFIEANRKLLEYFDNMSVLKFIKFKIKKQVGIPRLNREFRKILKRIG